MASLLITEGPASGTTFALENHRVVMIGRDEKCTFQLLDPEVSRMHLQIKHDPGDDKYFAADFDSHNGVAVNGSRISEDTPLHDRDIISIGHTTIAFSMDDKPDAVRIREQMRKRGEERLTTMLPDEPPKT